MDGRSVGRVHMPIVDQFVEYLRSAYAPESVELVDSPRYLAVNDNVAATVAINDLTCTPATFAGCSPDGDRIAILDRHHGQSPRPAPGSFRVVAILPVFNEADVIERTLDYLTRDGIGVYVLDNWSTDATPCIARRFASRGLLGIERFPADAPPATYQLRDILGRVEQLATTLDADWFMLHDADERRRSPWRDVSLRDALYQVDRAGFNCIDHVTLNFWPTDNGYDPSCDIEDYFSSFEFSAHPGHFHQRRAWKNLGAGVSLVPTAGHDVGFTGRRVYPYRFLLKHYPLRSQAHAERKVLHERRARWNPAERALGWHQQYDNVDAFVRSARGLIRFDAATFYEQYLLERLSGVGIFDQPPPWATSPKWAGTLRRSSCSSTISRSKVL